MTNSKWWIGSNSQAQIDLYEISIIEILKHSDLAKIGIEFESQLESIRQLSRTFIEGANYIRNSKQHDPKYRKSMFALFSAIQFQLDSLKASSGIDIREGELVGCETCRK